jgi:hypothetical protein
MAKKTAADPKSSEVRQHDVCARSCAEPLLGRAWGAKQTQHRIIGQLMMQILEKNCWIKDVL